MLRKTVILMFLFGLTGCDQNEKAATPSSLSKVVEEKRSSKNSLDPGILAKWQASCALCHIDGNGGAPRIQNKVDWDSRLAKGEAELLRSTIEGLNNMPPLGYCMACEENDFLTMIDFMIGDLR